MGCSESTVRNAHADESDRLGLSVDAPPPPAADFKVIMAGNLAVGKSCLLHRFTAGKWDSTIQPTIGAAFVSQEVDVPSTAGVTKVKLKLWDTAGEEVYRALTKSFFKGAVAGVIVYDVSNKKSLEAVPGWIRDFRLHAPDGVIAVVGNKTDLPPEKHAVTKAEGDQVVRALTTEIEAAGGSIVHLHASAQSGTGVAAAFMHVARSLAQQKLGVKLPATSASAGAAAH